MMIRKIILIDHEPFTQRRKELFYIDKFLDCGFVFEIWDVSQCVYSGMKLPDMLDEERFEIKKIQTVFDFEKLLCEEQIASTIFIVELFQEWRNRRLFKLLSDYKCYKIKIDLFANTYLALPFLLKIRKIFNYGFTKLFLRLMLDTLFGMYCKIGKVNLSYNKVFSSSSIVFRTNKINHPDYESFRKIKNTVCNDRYIVFLDNYFPLHPDLEYMYKLNLSNLKYDYYNSLNNFFTYLEGVYGMPVVIAAHPKSNYQNSEFANRKVIKYSTNKLVLHSSYVVMHASNTISYVLLANKPVVFISTNGYKKNPFLHFKIVQLASVLNKSVYNIDEVEYANIYISEVDDKLREEYIYKYLTSRETENRDNFDILLKSFNA